MVAIIGGLIMLLLGIFGLLQWWPMLVKALQATVPALLIVTGIIAIIAGVSSGKDEAVIEKEEQDVKPVEPEEKAE